MQFRDILQNIIDKGRVLHTLWHLVPCDSSVTLFINEAGIISIVNFLKNVYWLYCWHEFYMLEKMVLIWRTWHFLNIPGKALWKCSYEKVFWKYTANLQENTYAEVQSTFIEITLRHGCSPIGLLYIFRTPFPRTPLDGCWYPLLKLCSLTEGFFGKLAIICCWYTLTTDLYCYEKLTKNVNVKLIRKMIFTKLINLCKNLHHEQFRFLKILKICQLFFV